jgi:hypothetical protein
VVFGRVDQDMIKRHFEQAERHVALGKKHIARQREIVAELERDGHDTRSARSLLSQFEELQKMHVADRDRHRDMLKIPE